MQLRDYASVLRGGWMLMLAATAVGALIGWGLSAAQDARVVPQLHSSPCLVAGRAAGA